MDNKISIVISKSVDGYSVNSPEIKSINYQNRSLDTILNLLKDTLENHLVETENKSKIQSIMNFAGSWEEISE